MARNKNNFKHPGGVLAFPRYVLRSDAYSELSTNARALMLAIQDVWRPFEPDIHYSVRRAALALGVSPNTAGRAFEELKTKQFISCVDEYNWFNGKARTWRLNWMPNNNREPTNEWMKKEENKDECHI